MQHLTEISFDCPKCGAPVYLETTIALGFQDDDSRELDLTDGLGEQKAKRVTIAAQYSPASVDAARSHVATCQGALK